MAEPRVLGIDPGTKSFDLCGLDEGHIFYEEVLETSELIKGPDLMIEATEKAMPLDLIAGPSGYGVELTYLKDMDLEILENWYLTYILLLKRTDLESALEKRDPGIKVYSVMVKMALEMKQREWPVCYLPAVINLPTVPEHRKFNVMDMGTADKMCCCLLGIHDQSRRLGIPYSEVSFLLVEMGYGYNAILGVNRGEIVDGIGGTTGGMGFLTSGAMDVELVQLGGRWEKSDVFTGGGGTISVRSSPEEMIRNVDRDEKCRKAWEAMAENVEKGVASMVVSVPDPKEILISGRLTRIEWAKDDLVERLEKIAPVNRVGKLEGSEKVKEAAQGHAMAADGIAGWRFSELIEHVKLKKARGTALDYLLHPKGKEVGERLKNRVPFR